MGVTPKLTNSLYPFVANSPPFQEVGVERVVIRRNALFTDALLQRFQRAIFGL